jgi:hypothetical protein
MVEVARRRGVGPREASGVRRTANPPPPGCRGGRSRARVVAETAPDQRTGACAWAGVLGDRTERALLAVAADQDRRSRPLHRLGLADRSPEPVMAPVEVERALLGPQPPDDGARLCQGRDGLARRDQRHPVGLELPHGGVVARHPAAADADAEVQPPVGDQVGGRGHLGEHGRRADAVLRW